MSYLKGKTPKIGEKLLVVIIGELESDKSLNNNNNKNNVNKYINYIFLYINYLQIFLIKV